MRIVKIISVILCLCGLLSAGVYTIVMEQQKDNEAPVISMDTDSIEVSVTATDEDLLQGVTAADNKDGDVTASLMVESVSNFIAENERQIKIVAFDNHNNVSHAVRTLHYTDYTAPHFTLEKPLTFTSLSTYGLGLTANLSATDELDGNISNRIVTYNAGDSEFDRTEPGEYSVLFSVTNSAGATSKFVATVQMLDTGISRSGSLVLSDYLIYLDKGEAFNPKNYITSITLNSAVYVTSATADNAKQVKTIAKDFDTEQLTIDNPVDTDVPGWYEVCYHLTDMYNNDCKTYLLVCVEG